MLISVTGSVSMKRKKENLEDISSIFAALIPRIDNAVKHQITSIISLYIAITFMVMPVAQATVLPQPSTIVINKTVIDVAGKGPSANITKAGDIISYQVNVTAKGKILDFFYGVTVTDPLIGLNKVTDILTGGQSLNYTGKYTVTQQNINSNGSGTGSIINIANVTYYDKLILGTKHSANDTANVKIEQDPSYAINKTVIDVIDPEGNSIGGNITAAGDVITYQVNVTNDGNVDLNNVIVTDSLIKNLIGNNDSVLNVTEVWTYTGNYTVIQEDLNSNGNGTGTINNIATVDCTQLDPENDNANVTIVQNPSYVIDKIITDVAGEGPSGNVTAAGDIIAYQVNVTNDGNIDLTDVTVSDSLVNNLAKPDNDTVLNVGETWTYTGNYTVIQEDLNSNGDGTEPSTTQQLLTVISWIRKTIVLK